MKPSQVQNRFFLLPSIQDVPISLLRTRMGLTLQLNNNIIKLALWQQGQSRVENDEKFYIQGVH